jgi:hypothetical protein
MLSDAILKRIGIMWSRNVCLAPQNHTTIITRPPVSYVKPDNLQKALLWRNETTICHKMFNIFITFKSGITIAVMYYFKSLRPQISILYTQRAVSSLSQKRGPQLDRYSSGLHFQWIVNHVIVLYFGTCWQSVLHSVTRHSLKKYAYSSNNFIICQQTVWEYGVEENIWT